MSDEKYDDKGESGRQKTASQWPPQRDAPEVGTRGSAVDAPIDAHAETIESSPESFDTLDHPPPVSPHLQTMDSEPPSGSGTAGNGRSERDENRHA